MGRYRLFNSKNCLLALSSVVLLSFAPQKVVAQSVTVDATIDSLQILMGKQAKIKLQVSFDAKQKALFPHLTDSIVKGIEILGIAKQDTQYLNNRQRLLITQEYTVTSFDPSLYYIPPFQVKVGAQVYKSKALALKVVDMPVDMKHPDQFFPQKDVMNPPFMWSDWAGMIFLSLLAIPLLFLIVYLMMRYRDNKPIIRRIKIEPKLPPHQQAMKDIERIKNEKIWQKGCSKEYYTELTETLRTYMQSRFGFNAMEMTSSEIIEKLMDVKDKQSINDLKFLFQTADLVKFAKHDPLMNENDSNLLNAIAFIDETKLEEVVSKPMPTEITIEEKRSRRAKIVLIFGIVLLSASVIAIITSVVMRLVELFL